jgi:hypothetical protein
MSLPSPGCAGYAVTDSSNSSAKMEVLFPQAAVSAISPISRKYSQRMAPWKERENISVFLKQCKA